MFSEFFSDMELIDDDAKKSNIEFVKINDKRFGKSFGVKKFPALTFFRDRQIFIYDGDLKVSFFFIFYHLRIKKLG